MYPKVFSEHPDFSDQSSRDTSQVARPVLRGRAQDVWSLGGVAGGGRRAALGSGGMGGWLAGAASSPRSRL